MTSAIEILAEGSQSVGVSIALLQNKICSDIRRQTQSFFAELTLKQKRADLVQIDQHLEHGLKFIVLPVPVPVPVSVSVSVNDNKSSSNRKINNNTSTSNSNSVDMEDSDMMVQQLSGK